MTAGTRPAAVPSPESDRRSAPDRDLLAWKEAFRPPPARPTVRELHGPLSPEGPCWPEPWRRAYGWPAFAEEMHRPVRPRAVERWEHGRLVEVEGPERKAALTLRWGAARTAGARVVGPGEVAVPRISTADRARIERFCTRGWLRPLVRAFEHVGAKAAHVGRLDPASLAPFADLGAAVLAARTRPRVAVLGELLDAHQGDAARLRARLDGMDRALDRMGLGRSLLLDRVPDHCAALWPLRNLVRRAERRGVLLREMSFRDYEDEGTFTPETPVVCLDRDIYGGGFEHDLFHRATPVLVTADPLEHEVGLLAVEGAAQAWNSLVLASRHSGPEYEGHARWPGDSLFEELETHAGVASVPEQIAVFRVVALVCHPAFRADPVEAYLSLLPDGARPETVVAWVDRYRRYVERDASWLRGLHPRYRSPVFERWRPHLEGGLVSSLAGVLDAVDDVLWDIEDLDLRTFDSDLLGAVAEAGQANRRMLLKALELVHLLDGAAASRPAARAAAVAAESEALAWLWSDLHAETRRLAAVPPPSRDPAAELALDARARDLSRRGAARNASLAELAAEVRRLQGKGRLPPPLVPADFATGFRELYQGVYYAPPVHVGADLPGMP